MIDNVLLRLVGAVRRSFEGSLLHRHAVDERFQLDLVSGDMTWETSYSLPGEGVPPRVVAEVTIDWSAWSQAAFRSWSLGEDAADEIEALVAVVVRLQRLRDEPDLQAIAAALPEDAPMPAGDDLVRAAPVVERHLDRHLTTTEWAVEFAYEGTVNLDEDALTDEAAMDRAVASLGPWLASTLVRAADLKLAFHTVDTDDDR